MNFFIWRKNNVSFYRYRDFCVFVKPADFKICDVIISIGAQCKLHLRLFLLNRKSYQNEFGQILVCCMTNISNIILAKCLVLETSSRLFYNYIKITIQQDPAIFNGWHISFLLFFIHLFKKRNHWNLPIFGY